MKQHVFFRILESSVYIYSAHTECCAVGWQYRQDKHDLFELLYVISGTHKTIFADGREVICHSGESIILSPGTVHSNSNADSQKMMEYFCIHFGIEPLTIKLDVIEYLSNIKLGKETEVSSAALDLLKKMRDYEGNLQMTNTERKLRYQIAFLEFMCVLGSEKVTKNSQAINGCTENEVKLAKRISSVLQEKFEEGGVVSIVDVYKSLNISNAYGHRVFKKVYGTTPYRSVEELRYNKSKVLLQIPTYTLDNVAELMSFSSAASFSKQFKRWSGITPGEFRKNEALDRKDANYLRVN